MPTLAKYSRSFRRLVSIARRSAGDAVADTSTFRVSVMGAVEPRVLRTDANTLIMMPK